MPTVSDDRFESLRAQGFTGATSDMLLQWLQFNGATAKAIPDAWREMLILLGYDPYQRNDAWRDYLLTVAPAGTGEALPDLSAWFWKPVSEGGAGGIIGAGPPPTGDYILQEDGSRIIVEDDSGFTIAENIIGALVDAGGPYSSVYTNPVTVTGVVTPGTDPNPTYLWTVLTGVGNPQFTDPTALITTFTTDVPELYNVRLTVTTVDAGTYSDTAQIAMNPE